MSSSRKTIALSLAALGVVFGDLGTSPLYALQEAFVGPHGVAATRDNVFGILSLFLWSLVLIVSIKYVVFLMRADNASEGGILALLALTGARAGRPYARVVIVIGLLGAALLYGDGVITPAISVLSAVEGLAIVSPPLAHFVVPITIAILIALFAVQRFGSGTVGRSFGPVLAVWFVVIGTFGAIAIVEDLSILGAIDPRHAISYFSRHGVHGISVLGAVVLCLTGGEALYADMGHFGARSIRIAWFSLALPALVLSYFGQGAHLLAHPEAATRPFYASLPEWSLLPMVGLATAATVIASQALITAVFSLTQQATLMGYWPRTRVIHTNDEERGQIYLPGLNWVVMAATLALVLGFRSSTALAGAFGLAVAGTMTITTLLFVIAARQLWQWPWWARAFFFLLFATIDLTFLAANALKIGDGGWLPLAIGGAMLALMLTWNAGRAALARRVKARMFPIADFLSSLALSPPTRVPGTAIIMSSNPEGVPLSLLHFLKHAKALHERVVLLSLRTESVPEVPAHERLTIEELSQGFVQLVARYGYMQTPNVPLLIKIANARGITTPDATYFLGRESIVTRRPWHRLFAIMHRNARPAAEFFRIPPNQVLEVGAQIEL